MADLLVHAASAYLPGRALRDARLRAVLYVGVCLPDLLYKGALYLWGASTWFCESSHAPLALVPTCYAAALLFEEAWRKRAFGALLAGSWLHLLLDLGKDYLGSGVILWGFPFTMDRVELGAYAPEETLLLTAPSLALILLVELAARIRGSVAGAGRSGRPSST
jgi:hypothetical protein